VNSLFVFVLTDQLITPMLNVGYIRYSLNSLTIEQPSLTSARTLHDISHAHQEISCDAGGFPVVLGEGGGRREDYDSW